jgi:hypothetical protein
MIKADGIEAGSTMFVIVSGMYMIFLILCSCHENAKSGKGRGRAQVQLLAESKARGGALSLLFQQIPKPKW